MLLALPIPHSTGFSTQTTNIGSVRNSGFEFSINTKNILGENFQWNTKFILSTLSNKVTGLGGIPEITSGTADQTNQIFLTKVGLPLRSFYGYKITGIWQKDEAKEANKYGAKPGDLKFKDIAGGGKNGDKPDGKINSDDKVVLGNSFPNYSFSIGNTFSYKNLSLNIFIVGVKGVDMLNSNLVDVYFPKQFRRNVIAEPYLNRWTPDHPSKKYPSFVNPSDQGNKKVNSYTVENASYLRLKSVQLSYRLPFKILNNTVRSIQLSVTGTNLYTLTNYIGIDPAVNSNGNANARIDYNAYPLPRTYIFNVKIEF
jgi:hypothetical protein